MDTKLNTIKDTFDNDDVKKRFHDMLGKKSVGFIVSVINVISNDKTLALADRNSILFAAATAATLDLPINPNLGFAYILPYRGKDGIQKAQFQMGYKGFIQLAQRSGQFKTLSGTAIYEGQLIEENPLTGYKFDFTKKTSDKVIGYAGYFQLINGFEKLLYMTVEDLKKHGIKYSQSYKKGYGLWEDNFEAMAIKTVLKLLLSKFAPLSIEMQRAVVSDQATIGDWEGNTISYTDNDNINIKPDVEDNAKNIEIERIKTFIENSKTLVELDQAENQLSTDELKELYKTKLSLLSK